MKSLRNILLTVLLALLAAACSNSEQFRVNGTIEGKPTLNLRATYYADGTLRNVITACREGEFEFFGTARNPAILEITDYDYRPLARLLVRNGETYKVTIDMSDRFKTTADGNDITRRWTAFLRDNADALRNDNRKTIADYIAAHPADMLSTLLLTTEYRIDDAVEADSLMAAIDPEARPSFITESFNFMLQRLVNERALAPVDTLHFFDGHDNLKSIVAEKPHTLVVLSEHSPYRTDSLLPVLRRLAKRHGEKSLAIADISLDTDTLEFKRSVRTDSATWKQGWLPGGVAASGIASLGIPSLPFFIVCDSTGMQLLRTRSAGEAEKYLNSL